MTHTVLLLALGLLGCVLGSGTVTTGPSTPTDSGEAPEEETLENRLSNGGFEQGESWWRPSGYANHAWSKNGDAIHGSSATFQALEGERAQKIWGFYSGSVPNDAEHGLSLGELSEGDSHVFSIQALTPSDDGVDGGSAARLFVRYRDAAGTVLEERSSESVNQDTERDTWQELRI
ncbi:MAG: hypothetical protein ACI9VR_004644, partial [Cognaticolwellia sp.]